MSMITMQKTVLLVSILMMVGMASAASSDVPKASQTPGDMFYFLDRFSESLELTVARAPIIGSPELEAKVRANHAAERLAEAQKLAENNRTEKVDQLMADYSKQINLSVRSARKANNTNLSKKLGNVSNNHIEVLQNVQKKVPEQAQKGIQNAIENSQKHQKELGLPKATLDRGINGRTDKPLKNLPNQSRKPGKAVNKTADRIEKQINKSPVDEIQNKTPALEQDTSETVEKAEETADDITETTDEQNLENDIEVAEEDVESRITGEAVRKPPTSDLP